MGMTQPDSMFAVGLLTVARRFPVSARADASFHAVAGHAAHIDRTTSIKGNLIAVELAVGYWSAVSAMLQGTGNHLVGLFECQFAIRQLPGPFDFSRHDP